MREISLTRLERCHNIEHTQQQVGVDGGKKQRSKANIILGVFLLLGILGFEPATTQPEHSAQKRHEDYRTRHSSAW